jgi:FAD/FMN-containing dehydrogenase
VTKSTGSSLGRRAFLGIAAGGAAAVTVPGIASAAARPTAADWTALAKDLAGPLVRPGDSSYPTAKLLFDPRFDGLKPAGIAYVNDAADVSTCLAFARKYDVPFAARSGGHSYAGWSGSNGLIIDVSDLAAVTVRGTTATVGAGTQVIDFYHALAAQGRAVPGSVCPTVGIAGLTLGGGVGVFARAYGLTCDNLESVQIVTANGALLTAAADPAQHSDLFWACQGGGGGNFGLATSFTFRTRPAPEPVLISAYWPWSQAAQVVGAWQSWATNAPDELFSKLILLATVGGQVPTVQVTGTYLGSAGDALNLLNQLYDAAGSRPSSFSLSDPQPFLSAMLTEAGCSTIGYQACHLPWDASGGTLQRQAQFSKSDFFTAPLSAAGIGALLAGVAALPGTAGAIDGVGAVQFDSLGGAVNRVRPGATAFVHRNSLFMAQYTTDWYAGATAAGISNQHAWLRAFWSSMRSYANGQAYQNYVDPDLANWRQAYYGGNYPRLAAIKQKYDPAGLFTFPQAITPVG